MTFLWGNFDPDMLLITAQLSVLIVLMHMRGHPRRCKKLTDYQIWSGEIYQFGKSDQSVNAIWD